MPTNIKKGDYVKIINRDLIGRRNLTEQNINCVYKVIRRKTIRWNGEIKVMIEVGDRYWSMNIKDVIKVNTKLYKLKERFVKSEETENGI